MGRASSDIRLAVAPDISAHVAMHLSRRRCAAMSKPLLLFAAIYSEGLCASAVVCHRRPDPSKPFIERLQFFCILVPGYENFVEDK